MSQHDPERTPRGRLIDGPGGRLLPQEPCGTTSSTANVTARVPPSLAYNRHQRGGLGGQIVAQDLS